MPFLFEYISDEEKQRFDFSKVKAWGRAVDTTRWVIDREQDAFLIFSYPEREPPYEVWYAFWLKGKVYSVSMIKGQRQETPEGKWIVPVKVLHVIVPKGMPAPSPEVDAAVAEVKKAVEVEVRGSAILAGWGNDIIEVQIVVGNKNKGAN